jgi:nucleoside-diphosphate-sugar epimerase
MKLLWDKNIIMNTVHVLDVCRAIWHLCEKEEAVGKIYNIADENHTTQGLLSELISEIFNINHDYWGNTLSSICKVKTFF